MKSVSVFDMDQESGGFWSKSELKEGVLGVSSVSGVSSDSDKLNFHDVYQRPSTSPASHLSTKILFGVTNFFGN